MINSQRIIKKKNITGFCVIKKKTIRKIVLFIIIRRGPWERVKFYKEINK